MRTSVIALGMTALTVGLLVGCNTAAVTGDGNGGGVLGNVDVGFDLGAGLGEFQVEAGVAKTVVGTGRFTLTGALADGGTFVLDPADISVTPSDTTGGKGSVNLQTEVLEITVWIDNIDATDTVCGGGDQYGPYSVTLGEDLVPISIDPTEINLTTNTIALLNAGEFSICISVLSPVSGTVHIATLTFSVVPSIE